MTEHEEKRRILRWAVICMIAAGSILIWLGCGTPAARGTETGPKELVEETTREVLDALRKRREELNAAPERIYGLAAQIIAPHFDFERMSRLVLGRWWRKASRAQRRRFVTELRTLLIRTYSTALLQADNDGVKVEVLSVRGDPAKGRVTVCTDVANSGSAPIHIDYKLYHREKEWKVYDLAVEGVSLVPTYRSNFADKVRRIGIEGLIEELHGHNAQPPGEARR